MCQFHRDMSAMTGKLGAAIDRVERRLAIAAARRVMRQRIGRPSARMPSNRSARPSTLRQRLPVTHRRSHAPILLDRIRRAQSGSLSIRERIRSAIQRARDAVRRTLDALRRRLRILRPIQPSRAFRRF